MAPATLVRRHRAGARRPPTESVFAFGSASSTPPQGGSDGGAGDAGEETQGGGAPSPHRISLRLRLGFFDSPQG